MIPTMIPWWSCDRRARIPNQRDYERLLTEHLESRMRAVQNAHGDKMHGWQMEVSLGGWMIAMGWADPQQRWGDQWMTLTWPTWLFQSYDRWSIPETGIISPFGIFGLPIRAQLLQHKCRCSKGLFGCQGCPQIRWSVLTFRVKIAIFHV